MHIKDGDGPSEKQYELHYVTIARYFHTHFQGGIKQIQLITDRGTIDKPLHGDCHYIESPKASFVYWFDTGSHVSLDPHGAAHAGD